MERSNREIAEAVVVEDIHPLDESDAVDSAGGLNIVSVGPSDMARALGVSGQGEHPKMVETIERVARAVKQAGVARLALPLNHPALPRNAAQLRELGVGYTNCAPSPEVRLLSSMAQ